MTEPGWRVEPVAGMERWIDRANRHVDTALASPEPGQLRQGGTWYVGLDLLPNDADGALDGVPLPLRSLGPLHRGQVSVVRPGYPRRDPQDSEGAHRFRMNRDAAHLDGLLPIGPDRRRMLREPHAFILGIPLTAARPGQSPLVVYEGSHAIISAHLGPVLRHAPVEAWPTRDLTEVYVAARQEVFERCRRVEVSAEPGQVIRLHRHLIHGIAPWTGPDGPARRIAYFRPLVENWTDWL